MSNFDRNRGQESERNDQRGKEDQEGVLGKARDAVLGKAREARDAVLGVADQVLQAGEKVKDMVRGQPDLLQLLKKDHEMVDALFLQLEALKQDREGKGDAREGLFAQLDYELGTHATVEEKVFYTELRKARAEKAGELVSEALAEHSLVKKLLAELASMPTGTEEWSGKLKALKDNVQHHVQEEEKELFKLAREAMDEKKLRDLGLRFEKEKQAQAQSGKFELPRQDQPKARGDQASHGGKNGGRANA